MQKRKIDKVDAIFDLREAVERKVRAEVAAERTDDAGTRAEFLDASLDVESKTADAIDVCHACDRPHSSDEPHERRNQVGAHSGNVVEVLFGRVKSALDEARDA